MGFGCIRPIRTCYRSRWTGCRSLRRRRLGRPIKGIPYADVLKIHAEAKAELLRLPGAEAVGLGLDGIHVNTTDPEALPKEVAGGADHCCAALHHSYC